ncbi:MAG TPA: MFS transporter [Candidatus Cybelea sp.]|nr:MFS transporter [Candidatus Cybelea sp.]
MVDVAAAATHRDIKVIGLISTAHASSHFFQLTLPPIFLFIQRDFGLSYTELGATMTMFFVASGLAQTVSGFLVDRFGARAVLFGGLSLLAGSVLLMAAVTHYWMLWPLAILAGCGNSVFHPADYSILNASIGASRIGRAYGAHTFGGNIGWAVAPMFMLGAAAAFGWRGALIAASGLGFAILAGLIANRELLHYDRAGSKVKPAAGAMSAQSSTLALFMSTPILLCFGYFMLLSVALVGVQTFLPVTLDQLYATPAKIANAILTGFLIGSSAGILVGGYLADRFSRHERIVASGLAAAAVLFLLVGNAALPELALFAAVGFAGFLSGITTPSRDMLVRGATPRGSTGKVFGFVYSGLDAGSAVTPLCIGLILDHQRPSLVFWVMAAALACAIFTAVTLKRSSPAVPVPAE